MKNKYLVLLAGFLFFFVTVGVVVACQPETEPTCEENCDVTPTETVSPTVSPCIGEEVLKYGDDEGVEPCTTPTTSAEPTVEVTPEPTAGYGNVPENPNDGRHTAPDGLGCAVHECKAPVYDQQGQVLSSQTGFK